MPSTSVQISMTGTLAPASASPAPRRAADRSDPPRPSVVVEPSGASPTKPPVTTTLPSASSGIASAPTRAAISLSFGTAAPNDASVATRRRGSTQTAGTSRARRAPTRSRDDTSSPALSIASDVRGETSSRREMPRERFRSLRSSRSSAASQLSASSEGSASASSAALWRAATRPEMASAPTRSFLFEASRSETRRSVTPPIAETTTSGLSPFRAATMLATRPIRSPSPSDVPPNLRTIIERRAGRWPREARRSGAPPPPRPGPCCGRGA